MKLDLVACIFVGYSKESDAYRLWDLKAKKIVISQAQAREEQVTPQATEFTTFDLLANESRLDDQGEVEAIETEPVEIGENRAIEVKRERGRPK